VLETPREAEDATFHSSTGKHFGGNILVELYNGDGFLRGLVVLNRTDADGVVQYADFSSGDQTPLLKFYVLGFSDHHNKSYSGVWAIGSHPGPSPWDYGLEAGTYHLRVWIRGYVQAEIEDFTLGEAGNQSVTIDMLRGGATQVTVMSMSSKPGTRVQQARMNWTFWEGCPPPRLRIYFYDSLGAEVGYTEAILAAGYPGVTESTATLNFTGHNWSMDQIVYFGHVPNALDEGNYAVEAYTYGYIQTREASINIGLSQFVPTAFPLLIGCRIGWMQC